MHGFVAGILAVSAALSLGQGELPQETRFYDDALTILLEDGGTVQELPLREYLTDVVLQEMPASFEEEALKAQCVAARTFAVERIYGGSVHGEADICGDPGCCQCYLDETEGREIYKDAYDEAREKVMVCVEETDGQVLVCGDELIEAVYFSSTGGSTESAAAVWGGEVPYLQPVSSPEPLRITERSVSLEEFRQCLPESELTGYPAGWIGEMTETEGGAVESIRIGGVLYTGTELRRIFSLKSARFTVAVTEDAVLFEVTGSGHGVGMSQYGANAMAAAGSSYRQILLHYYTDVELKELY